MTNYFSSDISFVNLVGVVLQQLHEPSTGSEAVPTDLVEDTINEVYAEVFNDGRIKQSSRENSITFGLADDTTLNGALSAGASSITLNDSSTWQSSGAVLLQSDIAAYTTNAANVLGTVTGVDIAHQDGEIARQLYLLSTIASDIDAEQIQYIDINGIPQAYMGYENLINNINYVPNSYSVFKGYLMFSRTSVGASGTQGKVMMIYSQKVTPLSADADKPTLIQNQYRIPLLAYGACMKIAASDSMRTTWDWWKAEYERALSQYIMFRNRRVIDRNNKIRPSIYQRYV